MHVFAHGDLVGIAEQLWNRDQSMDEEDCKPHSDKQHLTGSCTPIAKKHDSEQEARC